MKKTMFVVLLLTGMFILGCEFSSTGLNIFLGGPVYEESNPVEVFFCPKSDCEGVFINHIENAEDISCAFYDLRLKDLIDALNSSNARVVMDDDYYYSNPELYKGMNNIKAFSSYSLMHHKFCVFDEEIVITGSMNPTERGNFFNDNNIVVVNSTYISKNYMAKFDEMWLGKEEREVLFPDVYINEKRIRNYFCPIDCEPEIFIDLLRNADSEIFFMTFSFTRDDFGRELIWAHERGVNVKGVFERTQNNQWNEYSRLKEAGLNVRWDDNPANMHHKVFIIDNETVITGSMNPSNSGLERNNENVLILENKRIAAKFVEEFKRVWSE
ncbi:MAG: phospholipase D-like domain-containing protein [Candidatus Nanoarchaeia archaeon]